MSSTEAGRSTSATDSVQLDESVSTKTDALPHGDRVFPAIGEERVSAACFGEIARAASDLGEERRPMRDIARLYAEAGVPVFPCWPEDKKPHVSHGFYDRTTDLKQVDNWWSEWPDATVGIVPGDFGSVALDVDKVIAVEGFIEAGLLTHEQLNALANDSRLSDVSPGLAVESGGTSEPFDFGGRSFRPMHLYLAYDSPDKPPRLPEGAVQRHSSGYVIAPGSWRRTKSGEERMYRVVRGDAPLPYVRRAPTSKVVDLPQDAGAAKPAAFEQDGSKVAATGLDVLEGGVIPHGLRHDLLRAASVKIAKIVESEPVVRNLLRRLDQTQGQPPIQSEADGLAEVDELSVSAWQEYGKGAVSIEAFGNAQLTTLLAATARLLESRDRIQEWSKQLVATMAALTDPIEKQIALEVCKTKLSQALKVQPRDAESVIKTVMASPNTTNPDAAFGRAYTLKDLEAHPEWLQTPEAAIPYLAWPGLKTLFSAREKAGKSTFAMAGAAAVSRGMSFLGRKVQEKQRVLWISEEPMSVLMRRAKGMEADCDNFMMLPIAQYPLEALSHHAARLGADVVVVDTLYRLAVSYVTDENDSAQWGPVFEQFDCLTRDGKALLLLAHATKSSKSGEYRGSTAIGGFVDVLINMKTPENDDISRKLDAVGRVPTEPITVRYTTDGFELVGQGKADLTLSIQEHVLRFVQQNPRCTKTAVRGGVPFRSADVDAAISNLVLKGRIKDAPAGKGHSYSALPDRLALEIGLGSVRAQGD